MQQPSNQQITFSGLPPGNPYLLSHTSYPILAQKNYPNAQILTKENDTDIGYDVTLIARKDGRTEDDLGDLSEFETGWSITPPPGYHLELVAKDDLERAGYELVSGTKIIDPTNRSPLVVTLRKFRDGDDLELPYTAVRLVPRQSVYCHVMQVNDLDTSHLTGNIKTHIRRMPAYEEMEPVRPVAKSKKGGKASAMF